MKKHLIYLGYTGEAHRIALFDENNIVIGKLPVKDVPVLTDDLEFLNCTVVKGTPVPNLMGSKVVCSGTVADDTPEARKLFKNLTPVDLRAFKNRKANYLYGGFEPHGFYGGSLLFAWNGYKFWDGLCDPLNMYVIGEIGVSSGGGKYALTTNFLCVDPTGSLIFVTNNAIGVLKKAGVTFVPVGTPELQCPNAYAGDKLFDKRHASVWLNPDESSKVIWVSRRGKDMVSARQTAEYLWWAGGAKMTVYDMRKLFPSARHVGISGCASDAVVTIFPNSIEEIWLGMFYECTSLKAVFIPSTVKNLIETGLPVRRFKGVTIYSDSPLVKEYCERKGVKYEPCTTADEFLERYYASSNPDYISLPDAGGIAALAGSESNKTGASGTIWSAILFSCASRGIASEELQRRYPVVPTCEYPAPRNSETILSISDAGEYAKERCRTLAGALTQFYPLYSEDIDMKGVKVVNCKFGDYTLHVALYVFNKSKIPTERFRVDYQTAFHLAMLADSRGRIIHRFVCSDMLYKVFQNLSGACALDQTPSGVVRYADKLPSVSHTVERNSDRDSERRKFVQDMFSTVLPVSYGHKSAKYKLIGIDLHTGNLVTMEFQPYYWGGTFEDTRNKAIPTSLVFVSKSKDIKEHTESEHMGSWFSKDCAYNIAGRVR